MIALERVSLDIGATPVLRVVSLGIEAGRVLGLVGESGSGKSMSALSLMRLLPLGAARTGRVSLEGRELTVLSERAVCAVRGAEIGMIFQEPMTALNPVQTIGDQVAETLLVHGAAGRSEAAGIARERLSRVGLAPERFPLDRYPHELSGGQRQRVCIALAIALRPKLLIADEPTTALDVTIQAQILELLAELRGRHSMAVLLITHDLGVVAEVCDRVVVMYAGQVVESGSVHEIFADPKHPYTRGLLASLPSVDNPGQRLVSIPGTVPNPTAWPVGCRFADRCSWAGDECVRPQDLLALGGEGRNVRCWRAVQ